jgi:hypothetical protein
MTNFPAQNSFTAESRTNEQACLLLEDFLKAAKQMLGAGVEETLVISNGRISPTKALVKVDTEASAAVDDLDFIGNDTLPVGSVIMLRIADSARKVNIRHEKGTAEEIFLSSNAGTGTVYQLGSSATRLLLHRTSDQWLQLGPPLFGSDKAAARDWLGLTAFATALAATSTDVLNASGAGVVTPAAMTTLKPYESPQQTLVVSGSGTVAHGLGGKPREVWPVLRNIVTQWGFAVGEEVHIGDKITVSATATNVSWAFPATGLQIIEKNGGALRSLTDANWRLVVYARR